MPSPMDRVTATKEHMDMIDKALHDLVDGPRKSDFRFRHATLIEELGKAIDEYMDAIRELGRSTAGGV